MKRDIQQYGSQFDMFQKNKHQALSLAGLLQPLPIPRQVWEDISMYIITGLPEYKRHDVKFIVVVRFTKYTNFWL